MKVCPECDGFGYYEEPVGRSPHGDYLEYRRYTCEECHGERWVAEREDEDEDECE